MKNTFVKVLSMMMALMMIVGAFSMITVSAATCTHENCTEVVVDPTCVDAGFTRYQCNDCGKEFIDDIKAATGKHTWVDKPATEANCTEPAYSAHKECSVCKEIKDRKPIGNSLGGHVMTLTKTVPATCTDKGYTVEICARCGAEGTKSNFVDPAHKLVYTVTSAPNASICVSGTIHVTCSECDLAYDIHETNNHDWKEIKGAYIDRSKDPYKNIPNVGETCGFTYKNGEYCTICGDTQNMVANDSGYHYYRDVETDSSKDWYLGTTIPADKINADLLAMSWNGVAFGVGTPTWKSPTCDTNGYQICYCILCEKYVLRETNKYRCAIDGDEDPYVVVSSWEVDLGNGSHVFLASSLTADDINKTEYRCYSATRKTFCGYCWEVAKVDTKEAKPHDYDWTVKVDGKDVQMGTVVTPKTCMDNGYTTYTCEFCSESHVTVEATDVAKKEHTWSAAPIGYADTFNCKDSSTYADAVIYICTYENCNEYNPATKENAKDYRDYTVTGEAKHTYVKKTQPATCIANAEYYNECALCGFIASGDHAEAPKDKPAAGFNANNHVVTDKDQSQAKQLLNTGAAATCTTGQVNRYLCACNVMVDVTVDPAKGHNKAGVYTDLDRDGKLDEGEKNAAAFAGNCQQTAIKQGKYCTVCNTIVEKSAFGDKVPATHVSTGVFVQTVAPTCSAKGYDQIYYNCCGAILNVNETEKVATAHKYKLVEQVNQTCYATGTLAYYVCEYCAKAFYTQNAADQITDMSTLVIAQNVDKDGKPGHNWAISVGKTEEQCAVAGTKAHKICINPNCGEYLIDGVAVKPAYDKDGNEIAVSAALNIPAHGTTYMGWHTGLAPTCTTDGYKIKGEADYTKAVYACSKCDKTVVGKTNHVGTEKITPVNYTINGVIDCTKPTYDLVTCTVATCGATYFKNYRAASKTAHEFLKNDKKVEIPNVPGTPDCTNAAQDKYCCNNCDYYEYRTGAAALGHKINVNGVDIKVDFACNSADHKDYKGFKCVNGCNKVLGTNVEHEYVSAEFKAATCTEDGHKPFDFCKNCNKLAAGHKIEVLEATNHANKEFVEIVDGSKKYSCPDCQEYIFEAIKPAFAVNTTFVAGAATVVGGTTTTATVEIAVANGNLTFNVLELVLNTNNKFVAGDVNATATGFATDVEVIADGNKVQIYPANTAETVTITPDAKVSVTFTLTALETANGKVDASVATITTYTAKATGVETATIVPTNKTAAITATMIGNVNGDAMITNGAPVINAADYKATYAYAQQVKVGAAEYDAKYDINRDGEITIADAMAIKTFILSNMTAEDYLTMLGYEFDSLTTDVAGKDFTTLVGKDLVKVIVIDAK